MSWIEYTRREQHHDNAKLPVRVNNEHFKVNKFVTRVFVAIISQTCNSFVSMYFSLKDDKFNWSHHAMDTAKAVEALNQRDDATTKRHDFNNHMVTMSALHQAQKPLNDYIRNSGVTPSRPHSGKRVGKSPIKSHPSPFEEQDKNELKKGRPESILFFSSIPSFSS